MPIALNHKPFGQELEAQLADLEAAEEAVRGPKFNTGAEKHGMEEVSREDEPFVPQPTHVPSHWSKKHLTTLFSKDAAIQRLNTLKYPVPGLKRSLLIGSWNKGTRGRALGFTFE